MRRKVKKQHWLKGKPYIVQDVDAEVCAAWRERYFHATKRERFDMIIMDEHPVKAILSVEVVSAWNRGTNMPMHAATLSSPWILTLPSGPQM